MHRLDVDECRFRGDPLGPWDPSRSLAWGAATHRPPAREGRGWGPIFLGILSSLFAMIFLPSQEGDPGRGGLRGTRPALGSWEDRPPAALFTAASADAINIAPPPPPTCAQSSVCTEVEGLFGHSGLGLQFPYTPSKMSGRGQKRRQMSEAHQGLQGSKRRGDHILRN
eukprot:1192245-Prorocentrum_minimum.AAC.1